MRCVIDTSAYSAFGRGDGRFKSVFTSSNDLIMPLIVVGELRAGFAAGSRIKENEQLLRQFLDSPNVQTTSLTDKTTQLYAGVYASLKKAGRPIGTNDMWIASLAMEHDGELVTADSDFGAIDSLKVFQLDTQ